MPRDAIAADAIAADAIAADAIAADAIAADAIAADAIAADAIAADAIAADAIAADAMSQKMFAPGKMIKNLTYLRSEMILLTSCRISERLIENHVRNKESVNFIFV